MKVNVSVRTNCKIEQIEVIDDKNIIAKVNVPPVEGKANRRVRELLARHYKVPKSNVILILGEKSKKKVFEIDRG